MIGGSCNALKTEPNSIRAHLLIQGDIVLLYHNLPNVEAIIMACSNNLREMFLGMTAGIEMSQRPPHRLIPDPGQ